MAFTISWICQANFCHMSSYPFFLSWSSPTSLHVPFPHLGLLKYEESLTPQPKRLPYPWLLSSIYPIACWFFSTTLNTHCIFHINLFVIFYLLSSKIGFMKSEPLPAWSTAESQAPLIWPSLSWLLGKEMLNKWVDRWILYCFVQQGL